MSSVERAAPTVPAVKRAGKFDRTIVEGPIPAAVWKVAWPTMLQNIIGGMQGIVDHTLVGHYVGYTGNAAIGVSWQIYLVVIVFVSSMYSGMGVLVSRFAGAGDDEKVNRTVYQAFLTSIILSVGVLAPIGYFASPVLLKLVNATPEVQAVALPYLRIMFMFSSGMLVFFMLGGALRSAGDARTPLRIGIAMTVLNIILNLILIPGRGPIPALGPTGSAIGTSIATGTVALYALYKLRLGSWVVSFPPGMSLKPDWPVIRSLFRFGLPTGVQGTAMNIAGLMLLRFIGSLQQSAQAQAVYAVCYSQLFSLITWTSVGLMGATAAVVGQNLGAKQPERAQRAVIDAARIGVTVALTVGVMFLLMPRILLGVFGLTDPVVVDIGVNLLRFLSISGFFITVALTYTGGLAGTGDTRSPLYITIVSQIVVPLGICFFLQSTGRLQPSGIWAAILIGHFTRCTLSIMRFRQGKWRHIVVDIGPPKPA
jgi:putative MATE family efflux protein